MQKIQRYGDSVRRWLKARSDCNPLVHEPTPEEFDLRSQTDRIFARQVRERIEKETK